MAWTFAMAVLIKLAGPDAEFVTSYPAPDMVFASQVECDSALAYVKAAARPLSQTETYYCAPAPSWIRGK